MGLESANFLYSATVDISMSELLLSLEAEGPFGQRFNQYVLRDNDYWIDVEIQKITPGFPPSVWIRVALTNPLQVEHELRALVEALLRNAGGSLVNMDGRKRLTGLSNNELNEEEWRDLWVSYLEKRAVFRQYYGALEAAISGDVVFATIRDQAR